MFRQTSLIFAVLFLMIAQVQAQSTAEDSLYLSNAKSKARQSFLQTAQETVPIFQGKEFIQYNQQIRGTPFFFYSQPAKGTIQYNNVSYADILFAYDMVTDKVIIQDYSNPYLLIAPSEKIHYFILGKYTFFRPEADIRYKGLSDTGFYEIIYPGKTMVVAKKWKEVQYLQGEEIPYAFKASAIYFIYDQKSFKKVNSRQDLYSIFRGKEKEMKKMFRLQNLNFKKSLEQSLIQSASYYDQLKK